MLAGHEETVSALPDGRRAAIAAGGGWAVGYTLDRLVGVWAEDGQLGASTPVAGDSADMAELLWRALMTWATTGPVSDWQRPVGLVPVEVCATSGLLPSPGDCPTVREWFIPGTEPAVADAMTRELAVNRETSRLATIFTPPQLIERRVYTLYPPETTGWANAAGVELPPAEYDTIRRLPARSGAAALLSPEKWSEISGQWSVAGSAGGEEFAGYRLSYFPGLMPEGMQLIATGDTPVESGELGVWDTTLVEDGLYTLLLTVVRQDGTFDEVAIPVTVANE
jgi:hypothetical protein